MKTDAEKRAVIEAEDGIPFPHEGRVLDLVYRSIIRRKQSRERARLRRAKILNHKDIWFKTVEECLDKNNMGMTRQEAIAYLDRMGK